MKKFIAILLAAVIMVSFSGCQLNVASLLEKFFANGGSEEGTAQKPAAGNDEAVIGGDIGGGDFEFEFDEELGDDEQQIIIQKARPDQIECTRDTYDMGNYSLTITAYHEGEELWSYHSITSPAIQNDVTEYLGVNNDLVYLTEGYEENGNLVHRIRALNIYDGVLVWDNYDYTGAGSYYDFDELGNLYIGGALGPDCAMFDANGNTMWIRETIDNDIFWLYDIQYSGGKITLFFDMGPDGNPTTITLDTNGKVVG